jgi:hypothetical protein
VTPAPHEAGPYARELEVPGWECVVRSPAFPWHDTGFVAPPFINW